MRCFDLEQKIYAKDQLPLSTNFYAHPHPKAVVQMIHGMCEHKGRYDQFAKELQAAGFSVLISDLRGHGESILSKEDFGYFADQNGVALLIQDQLCINEWIYEKYPKLPIYMFAHSMGSLIARNFIQKYDNKIEKLILSGAPYYIKAVPIAIGLSKSITYFSNRKSLHPLIRFFAEMATSGKESTPNGWLSYNPNNIAAFNRDKLCGFPFTNEGYITLYELVKGLHQFENYQVNNPNLDILFLSGQDDPVTNGEKGLADSIYTLKKVGYHSVQNKVYPNMRHEILNECDRQMVVKDILDFFQKSCIAV